MTVEELSNERSIDAAVVDGVSNFDASLYEGQRVKIAKAEKLEVVDNYSTGVYVAGSTAKKWVLELTTAPLKAVEKLKDGDIKILDKLAEVPQSDGTMKPLVVTARFDYQTRLNNGKVELVISKHPKAKLWQFMQKIGVQKPSEFVGKLVTITTRPSKKEGDDRRFLAIAQ